MRIQSFITLITIIAFCICASGAAFALNMPTWPQAFSIEKGETFSIAVPVTQPGTISVSMTWQGGPLTAVVKDQKGVPLMNPTTLPGNSVKADYVIKPADLQRGTLWTLTLSGPPTAKITGQVTITFPPVDMAKADAATRSLAPSTSQPTEQQLKGKNPAANARFLAKRDAFLKARQARVLQMTTIAQNFAKSMPKQATAPAKPGANKSVGSKTITPTQAGPGSAIQQALPNIDIGKLVLTPAAALTSVSPATGKTGAKVVITGTNLLPEKFFTTAGSSISTYWQGAMFKVAANLERPGGLLNPRKNADGTQSIDATVPTTTGLIDPYNGNVCLYNSTTKTNTLAFRYEPTGKPTIQSFEPSVAGPYDDIVLHGIFFSRDDKAYLDLGNGDVEVPITYYNNKQIAVTVPNYTSRTSNPRRLSVVHQFPSGPDGGDPVWVTLKATEITIDALYYPSGSTMVSTNPQGQPGDPIIISGNGFVNPKVHFIVAPGVDKLATIDFWDGTTIRTSVPDVTGLANDYAGSVYVICDGNKKSNLMNFTFHPTIDYKMINLYKFRPDGTGNISFSQKAMNNYYMFVPDDNPDYPGSSNDKYIATMMAGHHVGELLWGFKDDDYYYQTKRLKNNWKVSWIDFSGQGRLEDSRPGTDSPYVKIHWWVDLCSFCDYYVSWHIQGPKGTSYY